MGELIKQFHDNFKDGETGFEADAQLLALVQQLDEGIRVHHIESLKYIARHSVSSWIDRIKGIGERIKSDSMRHVHTRKNKGEFFRRVKELEDNLSKHSPDELLTSSAEDLYEWVKNFESDIEQYTLTGEYKPVIQEMVAVLSKAVIESGSQSGVKRKNEVISGENVFFTQEEERLLAVILEAYVKSVIKAADNRKEPRSQIYSRLLEYVGRKRASKKPLPLLHLHDLFPPEEMPQFLDFAGKFQIDDSHLEEDDFIFKRHDRFFDPLLNKPPQWESTRRLMKPFMKKGVKERKTRDRNNLVRKLDEALMYGFIDVSLEDFQGKLDSYSTQRSIREGGTRSEAHFLEAADVVYTLSRVKREAEFIADNLPLQYTQELKRPEVQMGISLLHTWQVVRETGLDFLGSPIEEAKKTSFDFTQFSLMPSLLTETLNTYLSQTNTFEQKSTLRELRSNLESIKQGLIKYEGLSQRELRIMSQETPKARNFLKTYDQSLAHVDQMLNIVKAEYSRVEEVEVQKMAHLARTAQAETPVALWEIVNEMQYGKQSDKAKNRQRLAQIDDEGEIFDPSHSDENIDAARRNLSSGSA